MSERAVEPRAPAGGWVPRTPGEARRSHLESGGWRRFLVWGLRNLPLRLQHLSIPLWSAFFYAQVPHIRRAIDLNLTRLLGVRGVRRELLAFRTFTNYCRCVANAYRLHAGAPLELPARIVGREHLDRALAGGTGLVLATGHLGNWQLGPYLLGAHQLPPVVVVMNEEPDAGAQQVEAGLRDRRWRILYTSRSPLLGLELRAALSRGELVGLQMDRPGGGGLRVPCGAGVAEFAAGPAQLARVCRVPVLPVFFPLEGDGVQILIEEPLWAQVTADREADFRELTTRLASVYARVVRSHPDQWFNFYDFWGGER